MSTITCLLPNGLEAFGLSQADTAIVYEEIFVNDCYLQEGISLHDGDTVLDIGANTGMFLLRLNASRKKLNVFSFEPIPAIHAALRENAQRCTNLSVTTEQVGLSRQAGEATFTFFPTVSCTSTMFPIDGAEERKRARDFIISQFEKQPWIVRNFLRLVPAKIQTGIAELVRRFYSQRQVIRCPLTTLSEVIRRHKLTKIDLLKMDTERAEQEILAGIEAQDWPKIRQIAMEVHDGDGPLKAVKNLLESHGFRVTVQQDELLSYNHMLYARR
ncbi:MAG: FkbM family methyltransferase [Planctomycetaceae bacterium]